MFGMMEALVPSVPRSALCVDGQRNHLSCSLDLLLLDDVDVIIKEV